MTNGVRRLGGKLAVKRVQNKVKINAHVKYTEKTCWRFSVPDSETEVLIQLWNPESNQLYFVGKHLILGEGNPWTGVWGFESCTWICQMWLVLYRTGELRQDWPDQKQTSKLLVNSGSHSQRVVTSRHYQDETNLTYFRSLLLDEVMQIWKYPFLLITKGI